MGVICNWFRWLVITYFWSIYSTYNPPSGLTDDRWYRRRGEKCSPDKWSVYTNTIEVTVNALPTVTVNDATICEGDAAATFNAESVYTPNEDGINDLFVPFELSYEDEDYLRARLEHITFKVYNRWGISIYSISKEVIPKWNGYTNKGYQATSGTYYGVLEYKMIDSEVIRNNGFVELIR
jgi:gliding motility-associated-like protein